MDNYSISTVFQLAMHPLAGNFIYTAVVLVGFKELWTVLFGLQFLKSFAKVKEKSLNTIKKLVIHPQVITFQSSNLKAVCILCYSASQIHAGKNITKQTTTAQQIVAITLLIHRLKYMYAESQNLRDLMSQFCLGWSSFSFQ